MHAKLPTDAEVEAWLKTLGVESLCQWDMLVFLYRHQTSLIGADHLARLSGYPTEKVVAALDVLESRKLVARSRVSQGARLYQFSAPPVPPRGGPFEGLLALAEHRAGRLLLTKKLRRGDRTPEEGLDAARRILEESQQFARAAFRHIREYERRRTSWRKVI